MGSALIVCACAYGCLALVRALVRLCVRLCVRLRARDCAPVCAVVHGYVRRYLRRYVRCLHAWASFMVLKLLRALVCVCGCAGIISQNSLFPNPTSNSASFSANLFIITTFRQFLYQSLVPTPTLWLGDMWIVVKTCVTDLMIIATSDSLSGWHCDWKITHP